MKAPLGGGGRGGKTNGRRELRRGARRGLPGKGRTAGSMAHKQIYYSDKYDDEEFEYR